MTTLCITKKDVLQRIINEVNNGVWRLPDDWSDYRDIVEKFVNELINDDRFVIGDPVVVYLGFVGINKCDVTKAGNDRARQPAIFYLKKAAQSIYNKIQFGIPGL